VALVSVWGADNLSVCTVEETGKATLSAKAGAGCSAARPFRSLGPASEALGDQR
jgi:hypothetical protein